MSSASQRLKGRKQRATRSSHATWAGALQMALRGPRWLQTALLLVAALLVSLAYHELTSTYPKFRLAPQHDKRDSECPHVPVDVARVFKGTTVSVVVPHLNELRDDVLSAVHTVLQQTPGVLLEEVILLNDGPEGSDAVGLGEGGFDRSDPWASTVAHEGDFAGDLEAMSPKVHAYSVRFRAGVTTLKRFGGLMARGSHIFFYEPHCYVGPQWLEHLLLWVTANPDGAAMPALDSIDFDSREVLGKSHPGYYRVEWNFNLINTPHPAEDLVVDEVTVGGHKYVQESRRPGAPRKGATGRTVPHFAPVASGGVFLMSKARFLELNLFSAHLPQWGGDHVELAMKLWRCHGHTARSPAAETANLVLVDGTPSAAAGPPLGGVGLVPCSRLAHLFRSAAQRPFDVDIPTVVKNYAALAPVWLEEKFRETFFKVKPEAETLDLPQDEVERLVRERGLLKCTSMEWYMHNVDPELEWEQPRACIPTKHKVPQRCPGDFVTPSPGRATVIAKMPNAELIARRRAVGWGQGEDVKS